MMHIVELDIKYSTDTKGDLNLYVFRPDGYHTGGKAFFRDEFPVYRAKVAELMRRRVECRITNSGDECVLHCKDGELLWPGNWDQFWNEVGK